MSDPIYKTFQAIAAIEYDRLEPDEDSSIPDSDEESYYADQKMDRERDND